MTSIACEHIIQLRYYKAIIIIYDRLPNEKRLGIPLLYLPPFIFFLSIFYNKAFNKCASFRLLKDDFINSIIYLYMLYLINVGPNKGYLGHS